MKKLFLLLILFTAISSHAFSQRVRIDGHICTVIFPHSFVDKYKDGLGRFVLDYDLVGAKFSTIEKRGSRYIMRAYDFRPQNKLKQTLSEFLSDKKRPLLIKDLRGVRNSFSGLAVRITLSKHTKRVAMFDLTQSEVTRLKELIMSKKRLLFLKGEMAELL
jgi:hypothetical protein